MKTPYLQLKIAVDELYKKKLNTDEEIEAHFDFIRQFIEANGWDIDEYTSKTLQKTDYDKLN